MKKLVLISLGVVAALLFGCSEKPSAEEQPKDEAQKLEQRLEGQGFALLPFVADDARCSLSADPTSMDRATLATCARLDLAKLPPTVNVTTDPRVFDPRSDSEEKVSILAFAGPTVDGPPGARGWIGVVGLGPLPAESSGDGSLVKSSWSAGGGGDGIRPRAVFLLAPAAPLVAEGAAWLIAAGIAFFGAKAIVATAEILNQESARPIVEESERVITRTSRLINCTPDEHELLKQAKSRACDNLPNSCERAAATIGSGGALCLGLDGRRQEFQKCRDARQDVTDRCFGGVNDTEHARQIADMNRLISDCESMLARSCPQ